jgi:hypothetical protein
MSKFCANGHQMEDSWDMCPYCQKTGFVGTGANLGKTKAEIPAASIPVSTSRKTVVVSDLHKAPLVGWVVLMDGNEKGKDFRVRDGQNMIGSEPACEIVIVHPTISGRHASLRAKEGKFFLTDLDSTNGTYLNQERNSISREEIKDNDLIRLGEVTLKFKCL